MIKKSKATQMQSDTRQNGLGSNSETSFQQPPEIDQEEVRSTAYFLWEQDGRPDGRDEHYWWAALEKIARQKSSDIQLAANRT